MFPQKRLTGKNLCLLFHHIVCYQLLLSAKFISKEIKLADSNKKQYDTSRVHGSYLISIDGLKFQPVSSILFLDVSAKLRPHVSSYCFFCSP